MKEKATVTMQNVARLTGFGHHATITGKPVKNFDFDVHSSPF